MMGRVLIGLGIVLVVVGLLLSAGLRIPRLPGDIYIKRDNVVIYAPLMTGLLLSLLLTLLFSLLARRP